MGHRTVYPGLDLGRLDPGAGGMPPWRRSRLPIPAFKIGVGEAKDAGEVSILIQILILLTVLSLAPAILIMMTSFTRLVVVFSFLRHALGTQQMPPNQILIGLSLFLTFFIMTPVW